MQEGLAQIYMVTRSQTIFKSKIERHIPKKKGVHSTAKAVNKMANFFDLVEKEVQTKFNLQ